MIRLFTCPVCNEEHIYKIDPRVNKNMTDAYPDTFGNGILICNICCGIRLMEIDRSE